MECRISSLLHLNLIISQKSMKLIKNILLAKTWSKCMFELPNIIFNPVFTCFGCARQNVAEKLEIIARLLPIGICKNLCRLLHASQKTCSRGMCFILTITIIVIVIRNLRTLGGFSPSRFLPFQDEEDDAKECKEWKDCGRGRAMRIAECAHIYVCL